MFNASGDKVIDRKTDPSQIVIDRINEQYVGDFTDEDQVVLRQLAERLEADSSVKNSVGHDGSTIFKKTCSRRSLVRSRVNRSRRTWKRSSRCSRILKSVRRS